MHIRKAEVKDKESIWKIHTDAIRNVCNSHYDEEQVETWANKIKPDSYLKSIEEKELYIAEIDNTVAGFGQLNPDTKEIEAMYVMSSQINKGVGRKLFDKLEKAAKQKGINKLSLLSSLNAVDFYKKLGFSPKDETVHRISAYIVLPCIHMEKEIKKD